MAQSWVTYPLKGFLASKGTAYNGQGLAMWRYSVLRQPELMLSKDMKMKIYFITRLYSSVEYVNQQRFEVEDLFVKPPYRQTPCYQQFCIVRGTPLVDFLFFCYFKCPVSCIGICPFSFMVQNIQVKTNFHCRTRPCLYANVSSNCNVLVFPIPY